MYSQQLHASLVNCRVRTEKLCLPKQKFSQDSIIINKLGMITLYSYLCYNEQQAGRDINILLLGTPSSGSSKSN